METINLERDGLELSALIGGDGPLVILMHGFPDTRESWSHQWHGLIAAGYRCLIPSMRGYEPGSAKKEVGAYAIETIAEDIIAWMDLLGVKAAHIVGHDWGAVNAYVLASSYPRRVLSLTTLAIPHVSGIRTGALHNPSQLINSSYMLLFQFRGLAEWIVSRREFAFIDFLWRRWSPNYESYCESTERVKSALKQPGVLKATLNYYRAFFSRRFRPSEQVMARTLEMPTLMIAGEYDACMDVGLYDYIDPSYFADELRVERLPEAGHFMQLEKPQVVTRLLVEWISKHSLSTQADRSKSLVI